MSAAPENIEVCVNAKGLGCLGLRVDVQGPCCCRAHTDPNGLRCHLGTMVLSELGMLPRTTSGSMVLAQPGSVLMSMVAHVFTKVYIDAWGLGHNLWP